MSSNYDVIIATADEADRLRLATLLRRRAEPLCVKTSPFLVPPGADASGEPDHGAAAEPDRRRGVCLLTDAAMIERSPTDATRRLFRRGGGLGTVVLRGADGDEDGLGALLRDREELTIQTFPWSEIDGGDAGADHLARAVRHAIEIAELEMKLSRRAEEIARLNQALSHDLSAPLGSLQRLLDLSLKALAGGDSATAGEVVARARAAAKRAGRLIKALETHAAVGEAGAEIGAPMVQSAVLADVVRAAAQTVAAERRAEKPDAEVDFDIAIAELPAAEVCAARVTQIVEELLRNALLFNDSARIEVIVRGADLQGAVEICVEDNGLGVDPEYLAAIFEPLTRLHGPQRYPGSGLGLATCRQLTAELGGRIWAENRTPDAAGLRVRLRLPV